MEGKARKAGIIVLGIGALGLLVALAAGCGPRSPFEGRDHAWSPWKGRHGFHGKDFPERVLKHMDERVQGLNLTEIQKEKYAVIRQKAKQELIGGREKRRDLVASIRKEMQKDLPDIHEVAGMVSEHVGMIPGVVDRSMNLFLEFYEVLDEKQKANVIEHMRDRMKWIPFNSAAAVEEGSNEGGGESSWGSLSEQIAQKRGDRNGELL